jgi:hypothetical protein
MSSKAALRMVTTAVCAAACSLAGAQAVTPSSQTQVTQATKRFVGPRLVASIAAPAPLNFSPSSFADAAAPSLTSSSSSVSTAYSSALPPISAQFESIFVVECRTASRGKTVGPEVDSESADGSREPCVRAPSPAVYARFLDSPAPFPLTPSQKGWLAIHDVKDPGNLATIFSASAVTVALKPHAAFGPGMAGFGRASMYSLSQDATQEFFSTFVVSSLAHEDPRYHRLPNASVPRRILHAVGHTLIAHTDSGRPMPNVATLSAYPIAAELANLYVPGVHARSTADRILISYATDPIDNVISEFLPDVARHVHVRVIFAQRMLNQMSSDDFVLP